MYKIDSNLKFEIKKQTFDVEKFALTKCFRDLFRFRFIDAKIDAIRVSKQYSKSSKSSSFSNDAFSNDAFDRSTLLFSFVFSISIVFVFVLIELVVFLSSMKFMSSFVKL